MKQRMAARQRLAAAEAAKAKAAEEAEIEAAIGSPSLSPTLDATQVVYGRSLYVEHLHARQYRSDAVDCLYRILFAAAFIELRRGIFNSLQVGTGRSIVMNVCVLVCLFVSVRQHISGTTVQTFCQTFSSCYVRLRLGLLRWRCDTLCTSGFIHDVVSAHNGEEWATRQKNVYSK